MDQNVKKDKFYCLDSQHCMPKVVFRFVHANVKSIAMGTVFAGV